MNFPHSFNLDVTIADIIQGEKGNCGKCPIALAMRRKFPNYEANVTSQRIKVFERCVHGAVLVATYFLPAEAVRFVGNFDSGSKVIPQTFRLGLK